MKTSIHPKLIAIAGGSGAGKTWLADHLQRDFSSQSVRLSQDDFYYDLSHLPPPAREKINFDHPRTIDWPRFEAVLRDCREGHVTHVPQYDFTTHTRLPDDKLLTPAPLILVDGLWLLWLPRVWDLFDVKIFLDCPESLRLERRLVRDVAGRGRVPDSVLEQFYKHVAPMHEHHVAPQAKWADLILKQPPGNAELQKVIALLRAEIHSATPAEIVGMVENELCLQAT